MKDRNENRPGYKKTKVGWIPEEWECIQIGKIFDLQLGKMLNQIARNGKNPQLYLANYNVRWGYFDLNDVQQMDFNEKEKEKFLLKKGDLLVCEGGEIGRCAVWDEQITPCYYQKALHRLRVKDKKVNTYYVMYYLHLAVTSASIVHYTGQTSINHLTREQFIKFPISFPPVLEQNKIAEILSTWDNAIDQTRRLIEAKKKRKKGLMQQLLSGKKHLPGFSKKWRILQIKEIFRITSRPINFDDQATYSLLSVRRRSGGIFLRGNIKGHTILTKQLYIVQKGDFIISKMQAVHGATAIVEKKHENMYISGSYITLKLSNEDKISTDFIKWLSKLPYFYHLLYLASYGVHIEKMTFNLNLFLKSKITIPSDISEQLAIVKILETAENEISRLEAELQALEQQKRGLMQKILTGEVRVKV